MRDLTESIQQILDARVMPEKHSTDIGSATVEQVRVVGHHVRIELLKDVTPVLPKGFHPSTETVVVKVAGALSITANPSPSSMGSCAQTQEMRESVLNPTTSSEAPDSGTLICPS